MFAAQPPEKNKINIRILLASLVLIIFLATLFLLRYKNPNYFSEPASQDNYSEKIRPALSVSAQETYAAINNRQIQLIDIRSSEEFEFEHIESSINLPVKEDFSLTNQQLLNKNKPVIIIAENNETAQKAVQNLNAEGYQAEYLENGIDSFLTAGYGLITYGNIESSSDRSKVIFISAQDLFERSSKGENFIFLDVRKKEDFSKKHIEGSINLPLELLEKNKQKIPLGKIVIIDENPVRSFQAAVRLYDMNMAGNYCLQESLSILEKITKEKINEDKQATP